MSDRKVLAIDLPTELLRFDEKHTEVTCEVAEFVLRGFTARMIELTLTKYLS